MSKSNTPLFGKLTALEGDCRKIYKDEIAMVNKINGWRKNTCLKFKNELPDLVVVDIYDLAEVLKKSKTVPNTPYDIRFCITTTKAPFGSEDIPRKYMVVLRLRKDLENEYYANKRKIEEDEKAKKIESERLQKQHTEKFITSFDDDINDIPTTPPTTSPVSPRKKEVKHNVKTSDHIDSDDDISSYII